MNRFKVTPLQLKPNRSVYLVNPEPASPRARCLCHNRYLQDCPKEQARRLNAERTEKQRCKKRGYRTPEAAEAHRRALIRKHETVEDRKNTESLVVYFCTWITCRESGKPYHVGHLC